MLIMISLFAFSGTGRACTSLQELLGRTQGTFCRQESGSTRFCLPLRRFGSRRGM